jgi:hypothetical protein
VKYRPESLKIRAKVRVDTLLCFHNIGNLT